MALLQLLEEVYSVHNLNKPKEVNLPCSVLKEQLASNKLLVASEPLLQEALFLVLLLIKQTLKPLVRLLPLQQVVYLVLEEVQVGLELNHKTKTNLKVFSVKPKLLPPLHQDYLELNLSKLLLVSLEPLLNNNLLVKLLDLEDSANLKLKLNPTLASVDLVLLSRTLLQEPLDNPSNLREVKTNYTLTQLTKSIYSRSTPRNINSNASLLQSRIRASPLALHYTSTTLDLSLNSKLFLLICYTSLISWHLEANQLRISSSKPSKNSRNRKLIIS